jgi:hypothetical protein
MFILETAVDNLASDCVRIFVWEKNEKANFSIGIFGAEPAVLERLTPGGDTGASLM